MTLLVACGDSSPAPTIPLRILVTNDDGVGAPGIDAVVEALIKDPNNEIVVSAPATNSSGSGDSTIETDADCGSGAAMRSSTASGYTDNTWAVDGCPADAVIYALENLYSDSSPHVVLSGINSGQNVGNTGETGLLSQISGTVGAAKTAACRDIPALASSQGFAVGVPIEYDTGLAEVLAWLADNRAALAAGEVPVERITSINIPSCEAGLPVRGRVEVPLGTVLPDYVPSLLVGQDCASMRESPETDIEAFFNGFVAITPVPRNTTCPEN